MEELARAGHPSVNAFLTRLRNHHGPGPRTGPLPDKNTAYDIFKGFALHDPDTTRSLAQALGSSPEAVTPKWLAASRALERKELAQRRRPAAGAPTWETLPQPSVLLEDLLRSQASAAEQFPYDLLGVRKPPLSEIYVEQDFQPLSPAAASPAAARPRHEPAQPSLSAPHSNPTPTPTPRPPWPRSWQAMTTSSSLAAPAPARPRWAATWCARSPGTGSARRTPKPPGARRPWLRSASPPRTC
ncbi:hypothetical protein [Streptomyces sp. NPDC002054]|uniref:hypothetical protein n=1 Tax=Streptomyces sp. NPDC002054 TaxID=3154663 RepID=UPI003333AF80